MQIMSRLGARPTRLARSFSILAMTAMLAACGGGTATTDSEPAADAGAASGGEGVSGTIQIDGSSTVFPISEAMAEEFQIANPETQVTVGVSGSGGGFKKFCAGETDISNASRPIKQEEADLCAENGIEFYEVPVAYDGLTVIVSQDNEWAQCLTIDQLNTIWAPEAEGTVTSWDQVDPSFPAESLDLYGPGADSGTFDYFTDEVNGEEGATRGDYTANEDDNVIVTGVQNASGGMGYLGYAYYEENSGSLKSVAIENEAGDCIAPEPATIADGSYNPMSRPLFFYVKKESYDTKPQVAAFVDYKLNPDNGGLVEEVGYITLPDEDLAESKSIIEENKLGKDPA